MAAPTCRACRHYQQGHFGPSGLAGKESICNLDLPTRDGPVLCAAARSASGDCGPEGGFFAELEAS